MMSMPKSRWINLIVLVAVMNLIMILIYFSTPPVMRDATLTLTVVGGCIVLAVMVFLMQWMLGSTETRKYAVKEGLELIQMLENGHEIWFRKTDQFVFMKEINRKGYVVSEKRYDSDDIRNMDLLYKVNGK